MTEIFLSGLESVIAYLGAYAGSLSLQVLLGIFAGLFFMAMMVSRRYGI